LKLVIAEKPSVAMSLAAVLGATERKDARDILLRQKERLFYSPAGKRWNGFTV